VSLASKESRSREPLSSSANSSNARIREMPQNRREFGNCRLRQFRETVGALCAMGGFLLPSLPSIARAGHLTSLPGGGEGEGDSVSAPVPPLTHAGNKSVSALSALTSQEPLTFPWRHARDSSLTPPVHPSRPVPMHPRERTRHRTPRGNRFWIPRYEARLAHRIQSDTGLGTDDRYRSTNHRRWEKDRKKGEKGENLARGISDHSGFVAPYLDYRSLMTWLSRK